MAKQEAYKNKLDSFKSKLTQEGPKMTLQKVVPSVAAKEEEKQLGLRLPSSLIKRLKQIALDQDRNVKDIVAEAIIEKLEREGL